MTRFICERILGISLELRGLKESAFISIIIKIYIFATVGVEKLDAINQIVPVNHDRF